MTNTERLVEAVLYASENDAEWWETFDSTIDATKVINSALRERPDEYQITCILEAQEVDIFGLCCTAREAYLGILRQLKKELKNIEEE
ncbi:MAG: hypothetical protein ACXABY_29705 [Candidatus Thorarchaeota archaeon]